MEDPLKKCHHIRDLKDEWGLGKGLCPDSITITTNGTSKETINNPRENGQGMWAGGS